MTISTIIFDCDGVLVDSEIIAVAVEMEHLARIGLHYEKSNFQRRFIGLTDVDFFNALERDYLALDAGAFPADFVDTVRAECRRRMKTDLQMVAGADALLEKFSGVSAVASSSTVSSLDLKLKHTSLHHHFDPHIYSGEQVANGKPAPDIFLHAAAQINKLPQDCVVIEDSINGVRAGRAAGMEVWGFTGGGHADEGLASRLRDAGAHEVYSSFAEITELL